MSERISRGGHYYNLGERILIIGCAGSGKTTLAKRLSALLGIPAVHLDKYYWFGDWEHKSYAEWDATVLELCEKPRWIMDGNYSDSMPIRFKYATGVIFIDMPRWKCLLRVLSRRFKYFYGQPRDDIPESCRERINLEFYRWIWNYPKRSRHRALQLLKSYNGVSFHLQSNADVMKLIREVKLGSTNDS